MLLEKGYDSGYAKYCDHTVLRAYTTTEKVREFCKEAVEYGAASVSVNPVHIKLVHDCLAGSGVKTGAAVGFPLGANKTVIKVMEAVEAVKDGADEIDMVINIGALREGNTDYVYEEIKAVVDASKKEKQDVVVKVILETCYLTDEQKVTVCDLACRAGADFVKTSTGMGTAGATLHDVKLMVKAVDGRCKVKAAGGVDNRAKAYEYLQAGAERLGVSRVPQIVNDDTSIVSAAVTNQPPEFE